MTGVFITIEGPEGAGKTAQAERLAEALRGVGRTVVLTREPGGTALGEDIRAVLLGAKTAQAVDPRADALLFNAARAQLVAEVIRPALEAGHVVLCARFADSTLAYQGYGAGRPLPELRTIAAVATAGIAPDQTILLDVPVETGLGRKAGDERNRFETDFDRAFHERVRAGFLALAKEEPDRWRVVDAARSIDDVFDDVLAAALEVVETASIEPGSMLLRTP